MKLGTLCYIEKDNKYLMLHRIKQENDMHEGMWVGLGGKVEPGESPEECVVREVFEESGLQITDPKLRGVLTFPKFAKQKDDWYVFLFTATEFTGTVKTCNEGELAWVDKSRLANLPMHEGDYYFLKWIDRHEGVFSAKYIYEDDVLKDYSVVMY